MRMFDTSVTNSFEGVFVATIADTVGSTVLYSGISDHTSVDTLGPSPDGRPAHESSP